MNIKSIKESRLFRDLIKIAVYIAAVIILPSLFLALFTQHNAEITVPDFRGLDVESATALAEKSHVTFILQDSAHVADLRPGAIYSQNPESGTRVKRGRKVRVVINAISPKTVMMPSLVGYSLRRACEELSSKDLSVGSLIYVHDMATNNVLNQYMDGKPVEAGTLIRCGSTIDIELGLSPSDSRAVIPNLVGTTYLESVDILKMNSFNLGGVRFDETVDSYTDTLRAFVCNQTPLNVTDAFRRGTEVTLHYTLDTAKISPYLKEQMELSEKESTTAEQK